MEQIEKTDVYKISKNTAAIYAFINSVDGKAYVGSSSQLRNRAWVHIKELNKGIHKSTHFQNAWNKYQFISFNFYILERLSNPTKIEKFAREQYWIDFYKSKGLLYNILPIAGSNNQYIMPQETKDKISKANKGKKKGPMPLEVRKKVSESKIKQFCLNGHDTFIVGREKSSGSCKECKRISQRKYEPGKRPKKQFCKHGHDTYITGRHNGGACKICSNEYSKIWKQINR